MGSEEPVCHQTTRFFVQTYNFGIPTTEYPLKSKHNIHTTKIK